MVKPAPVEEVSAGGIVIATETERGMQQKAQVLGTLVAVGPSAWKEFYDGTAWAEVGDEVLYSKYGGKTYTDPATEEEYVFLIDNDIVGKLND
jgi:co-chaperonin GroES (HSP10)